MKNSQLKGVDFFCSGGGMSFGMQQAGIKIIAGVDHDPDCKATYEANIRGARYILSDISKLKEGDLAKEINIKKNDDSLVLIGCSPCQYWTIIRTTKKSPHNPKIYFMNFIVL